MVLSSFRIWSPRESAKKYEDKIAVSREVKTMSKFTVRLVACLDNVIGSSLSLNTLFPLYCHNFKLRNDYVTSHDGVDDVVAL